MLLEVLANEVSDDTERDAAVVQVRQADIFVTDEVPDKLLGIGLWEVGGHVQHSQLVLVRDRDPWHVAGETTAGVDLVRQGHSCIALAEVLHTADYVRADLPVLDEQVTEHSQAAVASGRGIGGLVGQPVQDATGLLVRTRSKSMDPAVLDFLFHGSSLKVLPGGDVLHGGRAALLVMHQATDRDDTVALSPGDTTPVIGVSCVGQVFVLVELLVDSQFH